MTPIRALLRAATADAHARLDARMGRLDLASPRGYGRFLLAQARALPPLERALEAAGIGSALPDWPARRRREALGRDLDALALPPPPSLPAPVLPGRAALWGASYVLEGSRLGARLLLRSRPAGAPAAFLGHGGDGALWRGFLAALEAAPCPRSDAAGAVGGALAAFALFERAASADSEDASAEHA